MAGTPDAFRDAQKRASAAWSTFPAMEVFTATCAPQLVKVARIKPGQTVLDIACGTGVVALFAARQVHYFSPTD